MMENTELKIIWDFNIETEHMMVHRRPDFMVIEKKEKNALPIHTAIPGDIRVEERKGGRESDEVSVSHTRNEEAVTVEN